MRTTLTIDEDVASFLERVPRNRKLTNKAAINEASRHGLKAMTSPPRVAKPFVTRTVSLGRCLIGNLDVISEVLAIAEGEDFK
jgi:hypothetical protein